MTYKRLNNMTGMDPVLNRRISSIFLNEFEAFLKTLSELPTHENGDAFQFSLHKIRPSLVIFELDSVIKLYDKLSARKREGEREGAKKIERGRRREERDREKENSW